MIRRVFVYGTLRKGWGLNRYIQHYGGDLIATTKLEGFKMFSLGPYPAINPSESKEDYVVGEIYEFPSLTADEAMEILDRIELGAGYKRGVVKLLDKDTYTYIHKTNFEERNFKVMKDWTKENER